MNYRVSWPIASRSFRAMVASWESGWSLVFVGGRGGGWGAWRDLWGVRV